MARPQKCRTVWSMPQSEGFAPIGFEPRCYDDPIHLTIDEYETIRLIDYMSQSQEECASSMHISRSTVTNIYDSARKKIAAALINEKTLLIEGGNYDISSDNIKTVKFAKEIENMKIAVTFENGQIFQHFGHCKNFKIYIVESGEVISSSIEATGDSGHNALSDFLKGLGVDALICGGIGGGAQNALSQAGIKLFGGVFGNADEAVDSLLAGTLHYTSEMKCGGHDEGHMCGSHHSSHHKCGSHHDDASHHCSGNSHCGHK